MSISPRLRDGARKKQYKIKDNFFSLNPKGWRRDKTCLVSTGENIILAKLYNCIIQTMTQERCSMQNIKQNNANRYNKCK